MVSRGRKLPKVKQTAKRKSLRLRKNLKRPADRKGDNAARAKFESNMSSLRASTNSVPSFFRGVRVRPITAQRTLSYKQQKAAKSLSTGFRVRGTGLTKKRWKYININHLAGTRR